jgi:hypothetical protein
MEVSNRDTQKKKQVIIRAERLIAQTTPNLFLLKTVTEFYTRLCLKSIWPRFDVLHLSIL